MKTSDNNTPGERLMEFITSSNLSINKFSKKLGYSSSTTVLEAVKGKRSISPDLRHRLFINFPELNPEWLLKGSLPRLLTIYSTPETAETLNEDQVSMLIKEKDFIISQQKTIISQQRDTIDEMLKNMKK